nr:immunoglobulin heavy chain junction region [Macaca mulatta]MOV89684.1 immunoglobulin heavy chain junction region [Macaca mulatta]
CAKNEEGGTSFASW